MLPEARYTSGARNGAPRRPSGPPFVADIEPSRLRTSASYGESPRWLSLPPWMFHGGPGNLRWRTRCQTLRSPRARSARHTHHLRCAWIAATTHTPAGTARVIRPRMTQPRMAFATRGSRHTCGGPEPATARAAARRLYVAPATACPDAAAPQAGADRGRHRRERGAHRPPAGLRGRHDAESRVRAGRGRRLADWRRRLPPHARCTPSGAEALPALRSRNRWPATGCTRSRSARPAGSS